MKRTFVATSIGSILGTLVLIVVGLIAAAFCEATMVDDDRRRTGL